MRNGAKSLRSDLSDLRHSLGAPTPCLLVSLPDCIVTPVEQVILTTRPQPEVVTNLGFLTTLWVTMEGGQIKPEHNWGFLMTSSKRGGQQYLRHRCLRTRQRPYYFSDVIVQGVFFHCADISLSVVSVTFY